LLLSGDGLADSGVLIGIVGLQVVAGGFVWKEFRRTDRIEFFEYLGMGGAIGFGLSLLSSQLFREIAPRSISWALLPITAVAVCLVFESKDKNLGVSENQQAGDVAIVLAGTLIALSTSWYWLIPSAIAGALIASWLYFRVAKDSANKNLYLVVNLVGLVGIALAIRAGSRLFGLEKIRNPLWWDLRFGFLQDPDVIFNESMINSVQKFGNSDNIFFAGAKLKYHWLSFAWEDTLTGVKSFEPFFISGRAGPLVVVLIIMALLWTVARRISDSRLAPPAVVAVVSLMCAGPIPFLRILHPYSFSFNFSLIFLYASFVFMLTEYENKIIFSSALVFLISVASVGSKVSTTPLLIFGFLGVFIEALIRRRLLMRRLFILGIASMAAIGSSYLYMYRDDLSNSSFSPSFSFGDLLWQKGPLEQGLPLAVFLTGFVSVLLAVMYPTMGLLQSRDLLRSTTRTGFIYALSAGISAIALAFLLTNPEESSAYLLQSGLAFLVPLSVGVTAHQLPQKERWSKVAIPVAVIIGFVSARLCWSLYGNIAREGLSSFYGLIFALSIPLIAAVISAMGVLALRHLNIRLAVVQIMIVVLISSSAGSYFANFREFYRIGVEYKALQFGVSDTLSGSDEYREMLFWLRENSDESDIVATNRYCSDSLQSPQSCSVFFSLTSALTSRQMLVEGSYPPGGTDVSVEREKRRVLVQEFIDSPSLEGATNLWKYRVRWIVADHAVTAVRNWTPFAIVRFTNEAGSILELLDPRN